jgi:hypothetical protein
VRYHQVWAASVRAGRATQRAKLQVLQVERRSAEVEMSQLVIKQVMVEVTNEVAGVEMGVLADGTPYLTGRGLSTICGTAPSTIIEHAKSWLEGQREGKFHRFLASQGVDSESLYIKTRHRKRDVHAYSDGVSMLILEYYAFEAKNELAQRSYRILARKSLRDFIYTRTGYDPTRQVPLNWRQFHDRLELNLVPRGYFSVFREMTDMVIASIRAGLAVDDHTVPDVSVGRMWSKHWEEGGLATHYGERIRYEHNYPDYFPQADSNPQQPWAYPNASLGEFRDWLTSEYLPERYPDYLDGKVRKGELAADTARQVLAAVLPAELPAPVVVPVPPAVAFAPLPPALPAAAYAPPAPPPSAFVPPPEPPISQVAISRTLTPVPPLVLSLSPSGRE